MKKTLLLTLTLWTLAGCGLNEDEKRACLSQTDCLGGFVCTGGLCEPTNPMSCANMTDCPSGQACISGQCISPSAKDGGTDMNTSGPDGGASFQYGDYARFDAQSHGLRASSERTTVIITSVPDSLGCALTASEQASPGGEASVIIAQLDPNGDHRCPDGVYPVISDEARCGRPDFEGALPTGCVHYKRWDASGEQISNRLATGGFIEVNAGLIINDRVDCFVRLQATFGEDVATEANFTFELDPLGPEETFCAH